MQAARRNITMTDLLLTLLNDYLIPDAKVQAASREREIKK
jgi:hypothetical protein